MVKTRKKKEIRKNKTRKCLKGKYKINFIKNNIKRYKNLYIFKKGKMILNPNYLVNKRIKVHNMPSSFTLNKNGVQLLNLNKSENLKKCFNKFKIIDTERNSRNFRKCIRRNLKEYMDEFMKYFKKCGNKIGIDYDDLVIVDSVYRNTDKNISSPFRSVSAAHIDFDPYMTDYAFIYPFIDRWGEKLEKILGKEIYNKDYWKIGKPIVKVCNVWISLTEPTIKNDTLIFCDLQKFNTKQIVPYIASRRVSGKKRNDKFIAQAIKYSAKNKWYAKQNMKMGEAYIFNSFESPHASAHTHANNCSRQSIECRLLFIKHKSIPKKVKKYYIL